MWDPRQHTNPTKLELHANEKGKGALTGLIVGVQYPATHATLAGNPLTCRRDKLGTHTQELKRN